MLGELIRKEILENIQSLRFILSLLLILSVFATSGFVFVGKYTQELEDHSRETAKNFSALSKRAENLSELAFYKQVIWRKPKVLEFCAEGFEKSLPNRFKVNVFIVDHPEAKSRGNFLLPRFSDIDWVFITSIILGFVALLLTYDSICGEKEAATLSLMLSGPVPRDKVLLSKYLGAMFTLGIPVLLGLLIHLIIVSFSDVIAMDLAEWLKILAMVLASILYLSIFVLLGMLVSSRTAKSSTSMVILLFLWVTLVVLLPSGGRIVADMFHPIPDRTEVDRRISDVREQIWDNRTRPPSKAGYWDGDPFSTWADVPARAKMYNEMTDARNRIFDGYINQMVAQVNAGRNVTRISPTVLYQRASEAIAGTGIARFEHLYVQIRRYRDILKRYVLDKDKGDSDSRHLLFEGNSECISQKPLDFNSVPQFQERDPSLGESLQWAIWDIGLLMLFNVLFFMASYMAFLRYDVR